MTTTIGSAPYLDVQTAHDLAFAWGSRSFIKSQNADDLRPRHSTRWSSMIAVGRATATFSATALGGAIGRVAEDATAYAGRAAAFDLSADSSWTDPPLDERELRLVPPGDGGRGADRTLGAYANGNSRSLAQRRAAGSTATRSSLASPH